MTLVEPPLFVTVPFEGLGIHHKILLGSPGKTFLMAHSMQSNEPGTVIWFFQRSLHMVPCDDTFNRRLRKALEMP